MNMGVPALFIFLVFICPSATRVKHDVISIKLSNTYNYINTTKLVRFTNKTAQYVVIHYIINFLVLVINN